MDNAARGRGFGNACRRKAVQAVRFSLTNLHFGILSTEIFSYKTPNPARAGDGKLRVFSPSILQDVKIAELPQVAA